MTRKEGAKIDQEKKEPAHFYLKISRLFVCLVGQL
jgi:hypothetical protein